MNNEDTFTLNVEICPAGIGNMEATCFHMSSKDRLKNSVAIYKAKGRLEIVLYKKGVTATITELSEEDEFIFSSILECLDIPETYNLIINKDNNETD